MIKAQSLGLGALLLMGLLFEWMRFGSVWGIHDNRT